MHVGYHGRAREEGGQHVFGHIRWDNSEWVEDHFWEVHDILPARERPLTALAVYDGPPEDKPDITFGTPGMVVLKCRDCLQEEQLREFVDVLYAEGRSL